MTPFEQAIVTAVEELQGCKLMQLVAKESLLPFIRKGADLSAAVERLVQRGDLIEVEYDLASGHLSGRLKSFLLPKGTHVFLHGLRT